MVTARIKTVFALGLCGTLLAGCLSEGGSLTVAPVTTTPAVTLVLTNATTGATATSVSAGGTVNVTSKLTDAAGLPVSGAILSFSVADGSLAKLTPASGTALTDATGTAVVKLDAAGISSAGATTVSVSGSVSSGGTPTAVSTSKNFTVGPANVTLSGLAAAGGVTTLSAYATAGIEVTVGGVSVSTPVSIAFSSTCANSGKATITSLVNSANGKATATYADKGCAQTDTITASVSGTSTSASMTLAVAAPSAASIQFVSATPELIVLKGTGGSGLVESSVVTFKLLDNSNQPIVGANVVFDLTTRSGGILLDSVATGSVTKQTDAAGQASVSVTSGTVPTAVWVTAAHTSGGTTFSSQSTKLQISTGRPAQDRFSLAIDTSSIEGWDFVGVTAKVTVIASDRLGNPVPDGTAINFVSSGGQIGTGTSGVCSTTAGTCAVTFTSANPRPTNGRVAILAYAVGEESFEDANGNNAYDSGEKFNDLGEAYMDADFSDAWNSGEQSLTFVAGNASACASQIPSSPPAPSKAGSCDGGWGTAHVRQQTLIVLASGSSPSIAAGSQAPANSGGKCDPLSFSITLKDPRSYPLPSGTTLSIDGLPATGWSATVTPDKVPQSSATGGSTHTVTFTPSFSPCGSATGFTARIKTKTPKNVEAVTTESLTVVP